MIEDCSSPDRGCSARVGTEVLLEFLECNELVGGALSGPWAVPSCNSPVERLPPRYRKGQWEPWGAAFSSSAGPELGPTVTPSPGHSWPRSPHRAVLCDTH